MRKSSSRSTRPSARVEAGGSSRKSVPRSLRPSAPATRARGEAAPSKRKSAERSSTPSQANANTQAVADVSLRNSAARSSRPSTRETRAQALEWLRGWTRRQCGIAFAEEQSGLLGVRLEKLCRDVNMPIEKLQTAVEQGDRALTLRVADAVSTNYTFFFREPEMFDYLRDRVFASMPRVGPIRLWSAAAASGAEAYSLAILARESLGEQASRLRILGTDLSERQLQLAETGVYRRDQLRTVDASRLARWFVPHPGDQLRVCDQLRAMCTFRRLNLLSRPWPFEQRFHVILLRNVLYYFEPAMRRELLDACYDAAELNGFLITSLTEPMADVPSRWRSLGPAIFQRGSR